MRKKNSTGIRLPIPFEENTKILIKTLTVPIYPENAYNKYPNNELNNRLILKHQKPTPKLQTPN